MKGAFGQWWIIFLQGLQGPQHVPALPGVLKNMLAVIMAQNPVHPLVNTDTLGKLQFKIAPTALTVFNSAA
jgi:hypothetical protein